jgi:broad specificity phosphatase PhoE
MRLCKLEFKSSLSGADSSINDEKKKSREQINPGIMAQFASDEKRKLKGGSIYVTLVRHGETEHNKTLRVQGAKDIGLNASGKRQARLVARRLSSRSRFDVILCSNLSRAECTAREIASLQKGDNNNNIDVVVHSALGERSFGTFEDQLYKDMLATLDRDELRNLQTPVIMTVADRLAEVFPNANVESRRQFFERAQRGDRLIREHAERVAEKNGVDDVHVCVVSHGGYLRALLGVMLLGDDQYFPTQMGNTAVTRLRVARARDSHTLPRPLVMTMNSTSHVTQVNAAKL